MNTMVILAVFVGGGLGSICRYLVSQIVMRSGDSVFPLATLSANVLSCIVMAIGLFYFEERIPTNSWQRAFLLIGFCGGFSTFSTFSIENFELMRSGNYGMLGLNVLASVCLCLIVFMALYRTQSV